MGSIRTSLAVIGGISILFVGLQAVGHSAKQVEDTATNSSNVSHDAYNMSTTIFEGIGLAAGDATAYMGAGAFVVIILALVYVVGMNKGGR